MDGLPGHLLLQILHRLDLADIISVSHTCTRLRGLALDIAAGPEAKHSFRSVAAATGQRLHAVCAWRDALLLAAWQRQQLSATAQGGPAATPVHSGLQKVLDLPDAAAVMVSDGLPPASTDSCASSQTLASTAPSGSSSSRKPARPSVEFSMYFAPGRDMLDRASCLVTDGRTTALLQPAATPAATQLTASGQQRAQLPAEGLQQQVQTQLSELAVGPRQGPCQAGQHLDTVAARSSAVSCGASELQSPCWASTNMAQSLHLLHGHLPPADTTAAYASLHRLLLGPAGSAADSSRRSSGPPQSSDSRLAAQRFGLRHLLDCVRTWCRNPASHTSDSAGSNSSTAAADSEQQQHVWQGPRQVLLLPLLPPPGSISGLQHPWPPQLAAGSCYQGLGTAGVDPSSGTRASQHLLQGALLHNEAALLLPAGLDGSNSLSGMEHFMGVPGTWWQQLRHLDLSGQTFTCGSVLADILLRCSSLASLSIAGCSSCALTFMMWPQRPGAASSSSLQGSSAPRAAAPAGKAATAAPTQTGSTAVDSATEVASLDSAPGLCRPASNLQPGGSACLLRVLDVSGCAELAVLTSQSKLDRPPLIFSWLQEAVGAMQHLQVLLACRLNVDAALGCMSCSAQSGPHSVQPPMSSRHTWPAADTLSCRFCSVMCGLYELDVSAATQLSSSTAAWLLRTCVGLRQLGMAGCKTLAADEGMQQLQAALHKASEDQQQQQQQQQPPQGQDHETSTGVDSGLTAGVGPPCPGSGHPSRGVPRFTVGQGLLRLCVGWGWSAAAISCVLRGSPFLKSFSAGVGACVTDSVLQELASACPHLEALQLSLCTVSSSGVSAVLAGCPHLSRLQLQECVGPFSVADMLQLRRLSSSQQLQGATSLPAQHYWQLSTLQLSGPRTPCTDQQLLDLLGITCLATSISGSSSAAAPAGVSSCHSSSVPTWRGKPGLHSVHAASAAAHLQHLCLVRVEGLTDALLHHLASANCQLQHLRLEDCFRHPPAPTVLPGSSQQGTSSSCDAGRVVSFSSQALMQLIGSACALSLRSLTLRHSVLLPQGFVAGLVQQAPLLQRLVLDACDLNGGFDLEPDLHGALSTVHVIRCKAVEGAHAAAEHTHHHKAAAAGPPTRTADQDLVVHMLNLRRSIHLPPG